MGIFGLDGFCFVGYYGLGFVGLYGLRVKDLRKVGREVVED